MKKGLKALAIAACLTLGVTAIAACDSETGGGNGGGDDCVYYLAGSSSGSLFKNSGDWISTFTNTADIPDEIHFAATGTAKVYELTADLYEDDEFQVLIVNSGWSGQMGAEVVVKKDDGYIDEKPGGGTNSNIFVKEDGQYKLTLDATGEKPSLSYERLGDPTVAVAKNYDFYVKGEKVTGWNTINGESVKFTANTGYTEWDLTVNLQKGEQFIFNRYKATTTEKLKEMKKEDISVSSTTTVIAPMDNVEATDNDTGVRSNFEVKGESGSYELKIVKGADGKFTLSATRKGDAVEYEYYVRGSMGGDTQWENLNRKMELNAESGKIEWSGVIADEDAFYIDVVEKGKVHTDENVLYVLEDAYALGEMSNQIVTSNGFAAKIDYKNGDEAATQDNFTISVDPTTNIISIKGEHDQVIYDIYIFGTLNDWGGEKKGEILVADGNDLKLEVTAEIPEGANFQFRTRLKGKTADLDWLDLKDRHGVVIDYTAVPDNFDNSANMHCLVGGTYKFTITIDEDGKFVSGVVVAAE